MAAKKKAPAKRAGYTEFYKDADGKWRWRIVSANNRILADSAEAYSRRLDCVRGHEVVTTEAKGWARSGG